MAQRMITQKTCPSCGKTLSIAAFNGSAKTADGMARTCRACINTRRRQLSRSTPRGPRSIGATLAAALREGDIKVVRKLLRAGLKPHWWWVCETMRGGHVPLAAMLLESGVAKNVYTMAAMGDALGLERRLRRVRTDARLPASMEPASEGVTPLHV